MGEERRPERHLAALPRLVTRRAISFDEALATVLAAARRFPLPTANLPSDDVLGLTLREDLVAAEPSPRFANSAMDGFAVRAADVAAAPVTLRVVETIGAGRVATLPVGSGEAIRIMTGAALPAGADAVVPIERTSAWHADAASDPEGQLGSAVAAEDSIEIRAAVAAGENVRPAGEDFAAGERLVSSGALIDPGVIAILAALGHPTADVSIPPRVAILSTGDELVAPGAALAPGQVRDSNTHMIRAMVRAAGGEPGPCWHLLDDAEAVAAAVGRVQDHCDVIVTLGGVSAGDFDPVKQALSRLGGVELWRVGMRPGGPQAFGVLEGGKLFFGLPGNPVSSAVVFEMLVRPALWTLLGRAVLDRPVVRAVMGDAVQSKVGRRDFLRVRLDPLAAGGYRARLTGTQSSGALSSIGKADGLAIVPAEAAALAVDAPVDVLMTFGGAPTR